jgi:hypothetical protein
MRLKYLKYIYIYIYIYILYIDKIVKMCILMCVCIIEFVVVLFKMLSCNALSVVRGTCLFADCWEVVCKCPDDDQLGRNM